MSIFQSILNHDLLRGIDSSAGITAVLIFEEFAATAEQSGWIALTDRRPRPDLRLALIEHRLVPEEIREQRAYSHTLAPWCWVTLWADIDIERVRVKLLEEAALLELKEWPIRPPEWLEILGCSATITYYSENRLGGVYLSYSLVCLQEDP